MKSMSLLVLVAWLLGAADALDTRQSDGGLRVVGLETQRMPAVNPLRRHQLRRRGVTEASLENKVTLYFVNTTFGTPPVPLRLHIDTGSSDLWVNTPSSQFCTQEADVCQKSGTYSANSSSTYEYIGSYFSISYVDGSDASGDYVADVVTVGPTKLDRLQFGVGYVSTSAQGILGIGYETNEVSFSRANRGTYKNLPSQMVADGLIQSKAYSMWLNDMGANRGSVLFGGIDKAKFTGPLQTLPIQPAAGYYAEILITLTGLRFGSQHVSPNGRMSAGPADEMALAVLLDTGASLTYLPDEMATAIYDQVQAEFNETRGVALVPCSLRSNTTADLTFSFSGVPITVALREMVVDLFHDTYPNGEPRCVFGIAPSAGGTSVLGDTFLRSAYVVFDLDNNEISLAPTKFNVTTSSIAEIGTGSGAVPGATKVANPVAATSGIPGYGSYSGSGSDGSGGTGSSSGAGGSFYSGVWGSVLVAGLVGVLVGV